MEIDNMKTESMETQNLKKGTENDKPIRKD